MNLLLSTLSSKYIHSNLGIYSISAYLHSLNRANLQANLREYTTQTPLLNILADIQPLKPDILALAVYIWNKEETLRLTKLVRQVLPNCLIVLGGPEVSFNAAKILDAHPEIDYIVQGEGEIVFAQLIDYLQNNGPWPDYISSRKHLSNNIAIVDDLNSLPFVYSNLATTELDNKIIYYESSRGCPYACSYCLSGISRNVRYKNVDSVIQNLTYLIEQRVKQVKFVDRTYNLDSEHYLPIMQFLAAQDTQTNFHFEIKADILTAEVLQFLHSVPQGRFQLEIGIQSTHTPTLQAINRVNGWQKLAQNVRSLLSYSNIHIHVDLIAGLPYEGLQSFKKSFNNVHNLWADMLQLGFLKLLPGAAITTQISEHGYKYMPFPPYEVLSSHYISYEQLRHLKLIEDLVEKYYNSNKYKNTLRYLIDSCYQQDAFAFYEQLALYLDKRNLSLQSLSSKSNLQFFREFIEQNPVLQEHQLELTERLYLDTFVVGENWCSDFFLPRLDTVANKDYMENFWRNEQLVAKYLPAYTFTSWRQIKKHYRIEQFRLNGQEVIYIAILSTGSLIKVKWEDFYGLV